MKTTNILEMDIISNKLDEFSQITSDTKKLIWMILNKKYNFKLLLYPNEMYMVHESANSHGYECGEFDFNIRDKGLILKLLKICGVELILLNKPAPLA